MRPERLPSIVFDASGKLRIPDVIPKLAIAPEEKAGAAPGDFWTARLPHCRKHTSLSASEQLGHQGQMTWFIPRQRLDQDLDHSTAAQADAQINFALVSRVIRGQGGFTALDRSLRPQDNVALEAPAAQGSGRLPFFRDQHPRAGASIGGALDAHNRRQSHRLAVRPALLKRFYDGMQFSHAQNSIHVACQIASESRSSSWC
jgi:hypothetical protein